MKILVRLKTNTLLDIDDAEYLRKDDVTLKYLITHAKRCTVGSKALYGYCARLNSNVTLSTSPVIEHEMVKYHQLPHSPLRLGWVGDTGNGAPISRQFNHKLSLQTILFPALLHSGVAIELSLLGVKRASDRLEFREYFMPHDKITLIMPEDLCWTDDRWLYAEIKKMDFGLAPMVDHPFNEAKSAFKAKQYLSVGVPTIASVIGENAVFVRDGENGFLCSTVDEFTRAIKTASTMSQSEYERMSQNALMSRGEYCISDYCDILMDTFAVEKKNI